MSDTTERACAQCGEPFTPTRSDADYCSGKCRTAAYRDRLAAPLPVLEAPAFMRAGRLAVPLESLSVRAGGLGVIGAAEFTVPTEALESRGLSKMPIEVFAAGSPVFVGDLEGLERDIDGARTTVRSSSRARRLERLQVCLGMGWGQLPPLEFARQAAAAVQLRFTTDEEAPPPVGTVATRVRDDGAGSLPVDASTVSAWRVLTFLARDGGLELRVAADELYLGPRAAPAAPRALTARGVKVTSDRRDCNEFALILRSRLQPKAYQVDRSGPSVEIAANRSAAAVAAGAFCYVYSVYNLAPVAADREAKRLAEEIAADWQTVTGEADFEAALAPGQPVTVSGVYKVLHVTGLEHSFAGGALQTRFTAAHVPPPPRLVGGVVIAPVNPVAVSAAA